MTVKQVSVFLENEEGRLREVTQILAEAGINIRALSLADTAQFGILRLIVDRHLEAVRCLHERGITVRETDVIAAEIEDKPGGLLKALQNLERAGLNVEYMYCFVEKHRDNAAVIFRVEDTDKAITALQDAGFRLLTNADIAQM